MVSLTIDGKDVQVEKTATILEAAATVGIKIPTLCWLQKVSPTGACRVCAVEIEGIDRPVTACNTPVKEGIKVTTDTEKLRITRRKLVEFLLINHPLDCPVCDAAGECELQNSCFDLGVTRQEYAAVLERRKIRYDWPLIESDPNRCILCEKCVKVDHEVVGADAIEVAHCGEATIIETVNGKPLDCEFCGNCVGVCPTGTLISKPFKFRGRPWSYSVTPSICAFCSTGCQIEYHSRNGCVDRVTSDDTTFNSGNLCINGRFGYSYLNSSARLTTPLLKVGDNHEISDWNKAMSSATERLNAIIAAHGAASVAGIASPRATNEENFLFQKLFRQGIGSNNIDSEARFGYAQVQDILSKTLGFSGASATIDAIDNADAILVIGSDLNAEATGVEYRVIKAATKNDAKLVVANMRSIKLKKFANCHLQYRPGGEVPLVVALTKLLLQAGTAVSTRGVNPEQLRTALEPLQIQELADMAGVTVASLQEAAALLGGKKSVAVLFGSDIIRSADPERAVLSLIDLALLTGAIGKETGGLFPVCEKTNLQGMLDMGCSPDAQLPLKGGVTAPQVGKNLWQILEGIEQGSIRALYLFGSNPLAGFPESGRFRAALTKLDLLIVQDIFANETTALAHVVFPAAAAAEKSGSFTTFDNRVQCLGKAIDPPGDARADWDILTEMYNRVAFVSTTSTPADIFAEIAATVKGYSGTQSDPRCGSAVKTQGPVTPGSFSAMGIGPAATVHPQYPVTLLAGSILFHNGTMSTFSENNLVVAPEGAIEISAEDAVRLGLADGNLVKVSSATGSIAGAVKVSTRVQPGLIFAPHHFDSLNVNALLKGNANTVAVKVERA